MNLELATNIRTAINNTLSYLRPPVMGSHLPEATRTALQAHLDALLKAELQALNGQTQEGDSTDKSGYETCRSAAVSTLRNMGYVWRGGVLWAPPIGEAPTWSTTDRATGRVNLADVVKDTPWYPDDSGEWVEVSDDCTVCPLPDGTFVHYLLRSEREREDYADYADYSNPADELNWDLEPGENGRIVAYKVVKP